MNKRVGFAVFAIALCLLSISVLGGWISRAPPPSDVNWWSSSSTSTSSSVASTSSSVPSNWGNQLGQWIWNSIIKPLENAFAGFISTIGAAFTTGVKMVVQSFFNVLSALFGIPATAISQMAAGIKKLIMSIFGLGLLAYGSRKLSKDKKVNYASIAMFAGVVFMGLALPPIGYAVGGAVIMGIGVIIAAFGSSLPPPISFITGGVGAVIVIIGAMIGLYGILPQYSLYIYAVGFTLVFIVAVFVFAKTVLMRR